MDYCPTAHQQRQSAKDRLGAAVTGSGKVDDNEYVPTRRTTDDQQQHQLQLQQQQQQQQPQVQQQQQQQQPSQSLVPGMTKMTAPLSQGTREDKVLAIKKTQEMLAAKETLKKKQEEKRKEAIKLTADLRKRKQELLDKQLMEMKSLIERVEKNPEQKDVIMEAIKKVQHSIDSLRKDLAVTNNGQTSVVTSKHIKTREQAQKEILDAELDLITAQQEGQDATDLQKR